MKICYVISTVNIAGGANRSLLDLLPYVIDAGHECTILACAHGSMEDAARDLGIPYKVIPFSTYRDALGRSTVLADVTIEISIFFIFTAAPYRPTSASSFIKPSITLSRLVYMTVAIDIAKKVNIILICRRKL